MVIKNVWVGNTSSMKMNIIENFKKIKLNEKIFVIHDIFDLWQKGIISNDKTVFLPGDVGVKNASDISKVYLYSSKMEENDTTKNVIEDFKSLNFYEKLDFMIYIFEYIYNDEKVEYLTLINITDEMNFKDLSDAILKYKIFL